MNEFMKTNQEYSIGVMPDAASFSHLGREGESVVTVYPEHEQELDWMMRIIGERDRLLSMSNRVASMLLMTDPEKTFDESINECFELIGRYIKADRIHIWRSVGTDNISHFVHKHEWLSETGKQKPVVPFSLEFPHGDKPEWADMFIGNGHINSPLSGLPRYNQDYLGAFDIKSIVVIPLYLQHKFWGLFCIDDCKRERVLSDEEIHVLRSIGLLISNAILKNEIQAKLAGALDEAERADRAKIDFFSNMSHEIRTPMNAIIGMATIGKSTADLKRKDYSLGKIDEAAKRLMGIINECLGYDKKQTGEKRADSVGVFKGRRILLAEDVDINREIVLTLLEPTLLEIDCAVNGAEAVRMFSEAPEKYNMIFMDVQMPEMDGYEATRRIRSLDAANAASIPIIAISANVCSEDVERCFSAGMNDHIGKPLNLDEVLETINKFIQ